MNKNSKVDGLIDGVVYNEDEERKIQHNKENHFIDKINGLLVFPNLDE